MSKPWAVGFGPQTVEDLVAKKGQLMQWYKETSWHHEKLPEWSSTQKDGICKFDGVLWYHRRYSRYLLELWKIWCARCKHEFDVVWKMLPPELVALKDLSLVHRLIKPSLKRNLFNICSILRWIDDPLMSLMLHLYWLVLVHDISVCWKLKTQEIKRTAKMLDRVKRLGVQQKRCNGVESAGPTALRCRKSVSKDAKSYEPEVLKAKVRKAGRCWFLGVVRKNQLVKQQNHGVGNGTSQQLSVIKWPRFHWQVEISEPWPACVAVCWWQANASAAGDAAVETYNVRRLRYRPQLLTVPCFKI